MTENQMPLIEQFNDDVAAIILADTLKQEQGEERVRNFLSWTPEQQERMIARMLDITYFGIIYPRSIVELITRYHDKNNNTGFQVQADLVARSFVEKGRSHLEKSERPTNQ